MATFTDTVRFVVEAVTGNAEKNLKGVREEIGKAEGVTGKARAAFSSIGTSLTQNVALAAAGAGTALAAFAADAIRDFQDTAREAGRLADTTGLATDEASRWLAVLRPLNVEGADLADILGNINTKASEGRLAELGIQAEDSHDRLKQTIEYLGSITDETERAARASELLGEEGTRQLAPLIASADTLAESLANVSDAQVISDEERAKAAEFDATMRQLNGAFRDFTLLIGGNLVDAANTSIPVLTDIANAIGFINEQIDRLPAPVRGTLLGFSRGGPIGAAVGGATEGWQSLFGNEAQGLTSTAQMAPPGTPGVSTPVGNTTVNNYYPPSQDGRETDAALQEYWRKNGRG